MSERRDTETLGAFVRTMRCQCKDTQAHLALRIVSYERHVSNIENGHQEPTMADLVCLALTFDIPPIDLYRAMNSALTTLGNLDRSTPSH